MNHNVYRYMHVLHRNNEEDNQEEFQQHHEQVMHHVPFHQHVFHLHGEDFLLVDWLMHQLDQLFEPFYKQKDFYFLFNVISVPETRNYITFFYTSLLILVHISITLLFT